MDRSLSGNSARALEKELLGILQDRDDIIEDRFDKLIKKSLVTDLEPGMTKEGFFTFLSKKLSPLLNLSEEEIVHQFHLREASSSTNIVPGVAIPHIIIPGNGKFEIFLARSRSGLFWEEGAPPVHAVFVLLGTADERNYHLRALMAVAQLLQDNEFLKQWNKAKDAEDLRSTVLLMPRKRD